MAKFEGCGRVVARMVPLRSGTLAESPFQIVRPKSREWSDVTFFLLEMASCLGTKRGLMQWGQFNGLCYNERDAARVSADLERADSVQFDLQKSVFDGFWLRIGRARRRR